MIWQRIKKQYVLVEVLKKTDRCKEMYAMTYIESQNCVIAYFYGRRFVRIWLDKHDDFEMIREIMEVLEKQTEHEVNDEG